MPVLKATPHLQPVAPAPTAHWALMPITTWAGKETAALLVLQQSPPTERNFLVHWTIPILLSSTTMTLKKDIQNLPTVQTPAWENSPSRLHFGVMRWLAGCQYQSISARHISLLQPLNTGQLHTLELLQVLRMDKDQEFTNCLLKHKVLLQIQARPGVLLVIRVTYHFTQGYPLQEIYLMGCSSMEITLMGSIVHWSNKMAHLAKDFLQKEDHLLQLHHECQVKIPPRIQVQVNREVCTSCILLWFHVVFMGFPHAVVVRLWDWRSRGYCFKSNLLHNWGSQTIYLML